MKILITGSIGFLGREVVKLTNKKKSYYLLLISLFDGEIGYD